ncbi:MAG: A/G-specific adenine glycosylase [Acidobacteriales bacterium]|nr:A/G-specific adenine glycosylase [Terriglobales bacterium]
MKSLSDFRRRLLAWYDRSARSLPWRRTCDPYRIWVSEIMLQQTRVAAVLPYYERFLERFPDVESLAAASEPEVLAAWSGLGYYSRARNMLRAARQIVECCGFPRDYDSIRALAGVGDYTAAAIASIAFGLQHAVVDGNVLRVLSRIANDAGDISSASTKRRLQDVATLFLDNQRPGDFNQALMELGATICVPGEPLCGECPLKRHCEARRAGVEKERPVKSVRGATRKVPLTLLVIEHNGKILLYQRQHPPMRGFWELPEALQVPLAQREGAARRFRHSIMNHNYEVTVERATLARAPKGMRWLSPSECEALPLTTMSRKALKLLR